jgi:hypothetical protein
MNWKRSWHRHPAAPQMMMTVYRFDHHHRHRDYILRHCASWSSRSPLPPQVPSRIAKQIYQLAHAWLDGPASVALLG